MSDTQQLCEMFSSEDIQSIFILIFILLVRLDGILACLSEEEKLSIFQVRGLPHVSVHADCWQPEKLTQGLRGWRGWVGGGLPREVIWGAGERHLGLASSVLGPAGTPGLEAPLCNPRLSGWHLLAPLLTCAVLSCPEPPCGFWGG